MSEKIDFEELTRLRITNEGIDIPEEDTIYNAIRDYWNTVFKGGLRKDNRQSPQGQLAMSIARQIYNKNYQLLSLVNQFNVNTATGVFLDNAYANFGIYRDKGVKSFVLCQCTMMVGTKLYAGDQVKNSSDDLFNLTEDYTAELPDTVTLNVNFEAVETGAINVDANTLTTIEEQIEGWVSVDNDEEGTIGDENTKSRVVCQCVLKPGTTIPKGTKIKNNNNDEFVSLEKVTAPDDRVTDDLFFTSDKAGAIPCAANTINDIVTKRAGWLSVNNNSDGIEGIEEENDDQFRIRAMNSHQINALGTTRAIEAKLMAEEGVEQVYIRDNRTKEELQEDGITITPNSTYICIQYDGLEETKEQIANIMHRLRTTATYIGDTSVNIQWEYASDGIMDEIRFQTAQMQQFYIRIKINTLPLYSDSTIKA